MFEIGDRVKLVAALPDNGSLSVGDTGIVCVTNLAAKSVGVRFDKKHNGHNCCGACEYGHGWFVSSKVLQKLNNGKEATGMFKVGDRVKLITVPSSNVSLFVGATGTVCVFVSGGSVGVRFDNLHNGHNCMGACEFGHGWFVTPDMLQKLNVDAKTNGKEGKGNMREFVSPQTGSVYTVANTGEVFVCFRQVGSSACRVRIQGGAEKLAAVRTKLPGDWGEVKDGDHLSVIVATEYLANAVADAVKAVILAGV